MEMKADVSHLPTDLSKIPSVSTQLKMDEISTLSKLANKGTIATTQSVITQAPSTLNTSAKISLTRTPSSALSITTSVAQPRPGAPSPKQSAMTTKQGVIVVQDPSGAGKKKKSDLLIVQDQSGTQAPHYPVAYATAGGAIVQGVQLASGSGLAVQTADGMIVYSVASSGGTQYAAIQQTAGVAQTNVTPSQAQGSYATIGVPAYVDLQGQQVQLVPVSSNPNQVVYWPSVQGGSQALAMVQGSQAALVVDTSGASTHHSSKAGSIITID